MCGGRWINFFLNKKIKSIQNLPRGILGIFDCVCVTRKMPRGRNLFLSLRDKLMTSFDQREDACVWTAASLGRVSFETCDFGFYKAETRKKNENDVDLVEDMRSCEGCGGLIARSAALRCGVCRIAYYCSNNCQKTHWSHHKKTCRKIIKSERQSREACKTAMRVVWSLYCAQIREKNGDVIQHAFSIDDENCILNTNKPESHSKYLTVMLMTRGDEFTDEIGTQKTIKIQLLDPARLLVFLKKALRRSMDKQIMQMVKVSKAEENAKNFRNTLIKLHNVVKKWNEATHSGKCKHFVVIMPMLDAVGFSFDTISILCKQNDDDFCDLWVASKFNQGEYKR